MNFEDFELAPDLTLTVLAVDDNPANTTLLSNTLARFGYRVIVANDGPQARQMARQQRPDLILLDVMMPGEDGLSVMRALKAETATAEIPVIFISGVDEVDTKVSAFELGAVDYITKPFHMQEVLARVKLHLRLSLATSSIVAAQTSKLRQLQEAQEALLKKPEDLPEAQFSVIYKPLEEAGGDIYEVIKISESIYGYFIGDISGHDIATAYLTSAAKALLEQNCSPIYEPHESMAIVNKVLANLLPRDKYMTACYARLNRRSAHLEIINCGHPPTLFLPLDGAPQLIESSGDVLGMFPQASFGYTNLRVKTGDRLVIFSDGLLEAQGGVWTARLDDLLQAVSRIDSASLPDFLNGLLNEMGCLDSGLYDDLVIMGIEV